MIKISKFTLDGDEENPVCACCEQDIFNEVAEISTDPGRYYHQECGLRTEHDNQKLADYVHDFMDTANEYAKSKCE